MDHRATFEQLFPSFAVRSFEPTGEGWDLDTYLVNGEWIAQFPRLPGSAATLERQIEVLPALASELSAPIPEPELVARDPVCMVYRRIEGTACDEAPDGMWPERLGRFLYDLHLTPPEFVGLRARSAADVRAQVRAFTDEVRERGLPLLAAAEREAHERRWAAALEDDRPFATGLVHDDLGPAHVLVTATGDLAGVIDWGDAQVGDPAWDFAWVLHAMPAQGERALAAYGGAPDDRFRDRARLGFELMPWHEVIHGLDTEQPAFVARGLQGVRERSRADT
jgi:aminoglycoside phosphotransferase (APT) family kinase protein